MQKYKVLNVSAEGFVLMNEEAKMSAWGSKLLRTDLSNVPVRLAICRCLPVSASTGRRQAGFLTTVRQGLENMLGGSTGDIFGSSRRGARYL